MFVSRNKKPPFVPCYILNALVILINEQTDKCVKKFIELNEKALLICDQNNIKKLVDHYDEMQDIIIHLAQLRGYLTDQEFANNKYRNFFNFVFTNKPTTLDKYLFLKYKSFFSDDIESH